MLGFTYGPVILFWRTDSLERTLMLARIEGKRRRGRQRMSRLDSITDSVDMNLSKFWEIVEDRGACCSSVVSDPVWPHRRQPTRLPRPWDSPGKNTGVGCHFLLQCMKVKSESEVTQSCPTLSDPMDCSPPGSSAHGIFQARVLEWAAIAFSNRGA